MLHGIEGRVPLLDDTVVKLAESTRPDQRATFREGKRLLRAVARDVLPRGLIDGRKRGFAVPLEQLFRGPWREDATGWLRGVDSELVDGVAAAKLLDSGCPALDIWALCALAAWDSRRLRAARVGWDLGNPID